MKKLLSCIAVLAVSCTLISGCFSRAPDNSGAPNGGFWFEIPDANTEGGNYVYDAVKEQDFTSVSDQASSYFSLDRNTASYSLVRNQIERGVEVEAKGVRIEEMINYFDYGFDEPEDKAVALTTALSPCPWNEEGKLLSVGLKTAEYNTEYVNANYVFLIDVSGSMSGDSRLGLAKKGLKMLLNELGERDLVSVVTYASGVDTVLDGGECSAKGKAEIESAISSLKASGSTYGSGGIERAYAVAQKHFITGGNNRVIIISDGDFNVGMSSTDALKEFVQDKAKTNIYLSVIGVGMGNTRDDLLETLAKSGNGNYAYCDDEKEARKIFIEELKSNLFTVAKDAKAGVTFTSAVDKYRLIGYDTKLISEDDFNNEKADAGEIGSSLCVSALYEIILSDSAEGKLADVEVRYKDVTGEAEKSDSVTRAVNLNDPSSDDLSFISCVAEFGLILRKSEYRGTASLTAVIERLDALSGYIGDDEHKKEFVTLVGKASETKYYL